ncbi:MULTISPECIES: hypothetical protein [Oleiagrimonas]|jgi:hypothetical protein|uniref:Uncharacterized protein n=1 Tax=Oleiagrimonas citrea TaxID=1665687 RepID=A0A846ZM43_9GAMM|nr:MULTISPECIES: hypothetical protein [Oleiagrimonas]NKZ39304.1 hypothetical protein [Oleiagrimonas citrea]RAP59710.1 hypothetical protein BTJ49_03500 [Oleiagrimonas sp. MCCC 1A03011]
MTIRRSMLMGAVLVGCAAMAVPAMAAKPTLDCKLTYSMTGWSAIYKHAEGTGMVTCADGTSMPVKITVKGAGLTAGKWHIDDGKGRFSDVHTIADVLGRYAQAQAHAGVVKSSSAQVLTKGTVSLALAGTGEGVDLGIDVGAFTISRR